jgi:HAT1-interacting factor 1
MAAPSQPGSGTATPLVELDPEETKKSLNVSLADLCAKATALYAHKKYEEAAEVYGQAAEMQAEMNGEMNPENAEILFLYGRALFKVGQSKSDVLGGKAPEAKPAKPKASGSGKPTNGSTSAAASSSAASGQPEIKKPLFQFEGDENFEDSDEEEEEGEEEEEEEEDDLATAFEVLDLARVLYEKKLEAAKAHGVEEEEEKGKGKESAESGSQSCGESAYIRHIKERLADTHDLLAEISLENERYVIAGS